ncbi:MAG: helix-turn-helix transcriptional regulator [Clostridia bacterium]|nr:helix-turn-helix transcriptional regulator [Clostridia bacterium]
MQLKLGEKIRELRQRDGRTQDNLAEALGVTAQAISRWESCAGYPDMELIPAIANYFHISIDALFGYQTDRQEKINSILDRAEQILTKQGFVMYKGSLSNEVEDCVNLLRAAAEEFPNEPKILMKLAQALHMWGWNQYGAKAKTDEASGIIQEDAEYNAQNIYWQEAVRVYEKLLKASPSPEDREKAVRQLVPLYCRLGEDKKAKALAEAQDSLVVCREFLLPLATNGAEKSRYLGERIAVMLSNLRFAILSSIALYPGVSSSAYEKELQLAIVHLYETIFSDGKFGRYHWDICDAYMDLARCEAALGEDLDTILAHFDRAFTHGQAYEQIQHKGETFSAPLLAGMPGAAPKELPPMGEDFWPKFTQFLPKTVQDAIRQHEKYAVCFT